MPHCLLFLTIKSQTQSFGAFHPKVANKINELIEHQCKCAWNCSNGVQCGRVLVIGKKKIKAYIIVISLHTRGVQVCMHTENDKSEPRWILSCTFAYQAFALSFEVVAGGQYPEWIHFMSWLKFPQQKADLWGCDAGWAKRVYWRGGMLCGHFGLAAPNLRQ